MATEDDAGTNPPVTNDASDDDYTPVAKASSTSSSSTSWGAPEPGGMGGSVESPRDSQYDPAKKPDPFTEVGASGLSQYGGYIRDEFLTQLQGAKGNRVYREMYENDAIVGALVFAIQMLVRKVEWRVEPPEAASVEDIVQSREDDRQKALAVQHAAKQSQLMQAQAGMAGKLGGGQGGAQSGAKPPAPPGASPFTRPADSPGLHQPAPGDPSPATQPGTNAPATSNGPGTNPSGSNAQEAALGGSGGLPGGGSKRPGRFGKAFRKAAGGGSGNSGAIGGIQPTDATPDDSDPDAPDAGSVPLTPNDPMSPGEATQLSPEDREMQELAVFVETCLHDMATPFADLISQIVTFIVYGFSFHEIVYKKRNGPNPDDPRQGSRFSDGKIGWSDLATRSQDTVLRWEFDDNGHPIGMWQMAPPKFKLRYIPLSKAGLFRTTGYKDNPQGRSILRSAYISWYYAKRLREYEAIGAERDTGGLPVAWVPPAMLSEYATNEQKATLEEIKKIVRNIRVNQQNGVVFPLAYDENSNKLYDLTLLTPQGGRQRIDTNTLITRYEQRIAMVALADFIMLGHDQVGARSLGETKQDIFTTALEAFLNTIADVFNTYLIPRLMQINNEDPAKAPKLTFGKLTTIALPELAQLITALSGAGDDLFPDVALEDHIRQFAGLPPKSASDDI